MDNFKFYAPTEVVFNVNDYVKLESKRASGFFTIQAVQFTGSNRSGDWICTAKLLEVKG